MIAAFLKAEIDSHRFGDRYSNMLAAAGWPRSIVDDPNLAADDENAIRRSMLFCVRGYPNSWLFEGFPSDVAWNLVSFTPAEVSNLFYLPIQPWGDWSGGTRLVQRGAETVHLNPDNPDFSNIRGVVERLRAGDPLPPLICVTCQHSGPFVVVEGHTRATAYALAQDIAPAQIPAFVGSSPNILGWAGFQLSPPPE